MIGGKEIEVGGVGAREGRVVLGVAGVSAACRERESPLVMGGKEIEGGRCHRERRGWRGGALRVLERPEPLSADHCPQY